MASDKIVALPGSSPHTVRTRIAANQVRTQLSLLQGYADLMAGLSPGQNLHILKIMALKTRELTDALQPFLDPAEGQQGLTIEDYRQARRRNQQLMNEYRLLLKRLRQNVHEAQENLSLAGGG